MSELNSDSDSEGIPLPCQVFDVICGSSSGGLIAVLIGRLGLDCSTAMTVYNELFTALFADVDQADMDSIVDRECTLPDAFETKLAEIVEMYTGDKDTPMRIRKSRPTKVNHLSTDTFVTVVQSGALSTGVEPYRVRSYATPRGGTESVPGHEWTVREVIRATIALAGYFRPVDIGPLSFQDASCSGSANPVWDAISEFALRWSKDFEPIIISLGTGLSSVAFEPRQREHDAFAKQLLTIARDTERAHLHAYEHFSIMDLGDNYFRFNPLGGLGDIRDFVGDQILRIIDLTEAWLCSPSGRSKTRSVCLVLKERLIQNKVSGEPRHSDSVARTSGALKTTTRDQAQLDSPGQPRDPNIRQLGSMNVLAQYAIEDIIRKNVSRGPNFLIDVTTGRLCDSKVLSNVLKSDEAFKQFIPSTIDEECIQKKVNKCSGYVMLSHVWGNGKEAEKENEPSFKTVMDSGSVHHLPSTPMNNKLRNFCTEVAKLGYRWAWSDTCCINKSDDAVLSQSLRSMYRWYESSEATMVYLGDVSSGMAVDLPHTLWMTRAWTLQEGLAPKRILFYDQDWKPYHGIVSDNHKQHGDILEELARASGIPSQTLISFHPDCLGVREKLRLASTRTATIEEDTAYSLIGIFTSDIIPRYGEGGDAVGHLLEGIVAHSGEVTVLEWTGISSSYNSCLPSSLAVYRQPSSTVARTIDAGEIESRTAQLSATLSKDDAADVYDRVMRLPPARFANRRLQLPCVVFRVKSLVVYDWDDRGTHSYRAKVSGIGSVEIKTRNKLPLSRPQRLVVVHPWISDVRGPDGVVGVVGGGTGADASDSDGDVDLEPEGNEDTCTEGESEACSVSDGIPPVNKYTLALQMMARLLQPFTALLLVRQSDREYRRVAAENKIVVQISESYIRSKGFRQDGVHTEVLDIL